MQNKALIGLSLLAVIIIVGAVVYVGQPPASEANGPVVTDSRKASSPPVSTAESGMPSPGVSRTKVVASDANTAAQEVASQDAPSSEQTVSSPVAFNIRPAGAVNVATPTALVDVAPEMKFSDLQLQAIQLVREEFISAIGGLNQDPNNPKYLAKWLAAQQESDDRLRVAIGSEAFLKMRNRADALEFEQRMAQLSAAAQ